MFFWFSFWRSLLGLSWSFSRPPKELASEVVDVVKPSEVGACYGPSSDPRSGKKCLNEHKLRLFE